METLNKVANFNGLKIIRHEHVFTQEEYFTMQREKSNVYAIPSDHALGLYSRLIPYINKAEKLNIPYYISELGTVEIKKTECIVIEIDFFIKKDAWKVVSVIDHLDNGNVIKTIARMELPEKYRTAKNTTCDHCNTKRYRKQTVVLYNEDLNEYKQVGKDCLKVYTGINVADVIAVMDIYNNVESYQGMGDDWNEYGGFLTPSYCDVLNVIALTWDIVKVFGYSPKSASTPTARLVQDFQDYFRGDLKRYNKKLHAKIEDVIKAHDMKFGTDESYKQAEIIKDYVLAQKVTNDYMNNMHVILAERQTAKKYQNFIVSAVAVYLKGLEKEKEYQKKHEHETVSNHMGNIGDKLTIDVKDFNVLTSWYSEYGYNTTVITYVYKFTDNNGNIYTWKTQKDLTEVKTLTGTVKNHNDYKGIKQTELTRCKVI